MTVEQANHILRAKGQACIRPATAGDLPAMQVLIAQAQAYFCAAGIDQWQDGYPQRAVLAEDIARGVSYVLEHGGQVAGMFMAALENDPNYAQIDGAWRTQGAPYAVLHRVAVHEAHKGAGLAGLAVEYVCRRYARLAASVRADTHADNGAMRRMLEKHGFVLCGGIALAGGAPRVGYEKLL